MTDVTAIRDNNLTASYLVERPIVSFGLSVYAFAITDTPAESAEPALIYTKSNDGGDTFGDPIVLATAVAGGGINGAAIYYDRWTRGNTGTKIHIVFPRRNSSGVFYTSIETLTDVQGPFVTIFSGVAASTVARHTCSICVTAGGNILVPWVLPIAIANQGMARSVDNGGSFSARISPWNADSPAGAIDDHLIITPANSGDPNDADIYFFDESGQTVVLRQYRDATNTLDADVTIDATVAITNPDTPFMHACHDHADGTTIFGLRDGPINVAHDFTIRRINGGASIVSLPNAYTAQTNRMGTGLCINNQTGDIYAAWNDSITPFSVQRNFIAKLPFGAGSFDAEIQNSTTDRDYNDIWLPTSIGGAGGTVLGLTHEQTGGQIHYVNPDNSVEIAEAPDIPGGPVASQQKLLLL